MWMMLEIKIIYRVKGLADRIDISFGKPNCNQYRYDS